MVLSVGGKQSGSPRGMYSYARGDGGDKNLKSTYVLASLILIKMYRSGIHRIRL